MPGFRRHHTQAHHSAKHTTPETTRPRTAAVTPAQRRLWALGLVAALGLSATGCSLLSDQTLDATTDWALDQLIELTDPNTAPTGTLFAPNGELIESELTALETLDTLPVKGRSPKQGYDREGEFGSAWADVDRNGCDTRNDMLQRDLTETVTDERCRVLTGVLADPFTGTNISFVRGDATSAEVQIDHIVSLSDAWQTGAQKLTDEQRLHLANDPLNLIAVDGPTNSSKGDSNAASWLPPHREFRCHYVARQISVKAEYDLWVTAPERDALATVLQTCAEQPAYRSVLTTR